MAGTTKAEWDKYFYWANILTFMTNTEFTWTVRIAEGVAVSVSTKVLKR